MKAYLGNRRLVIWFVSLVFVSAAALFLVPPYVRGRRFADTGMISLSSLTRDGCTPTLVQPIDDHWALIHANAGSSQPKRIYSIDLTNGRISSKYIEAGSICSSPLVFQWHTDGTASMLEDYAGKHSVAFVDPSTLSITRQPVPPEVADQLTQLVVAPDKGKIAYNTDSGAYLANLDFGEARCIIPTVCGDQPYGVADVGENVDGWSSDSGQIVLSRCGYEWAIGTTLYDVESGEARFFSTPDRMEFLTSTNKLLLTFSYSDCGGECLEYLDLNSAHPSVEAVASWAQGTSIVSFSRDGKYAALRQEGGQVAKVAVVDVATGKTLAEHCLGPKEYVEGLHLVPSGNAAVVTIRKDHRYSVLLWRFLEKK